MNIPGALIAEIKTGRVALFLGAGASIGAKKNSGETSPSSKELGRRLSERFLGSKFQDYALNMIGEYAINESDLLTVQTFIKDIFEDLIPTPAHKLMTEFKWWGLGTTNYDKLIEDAFAANSSSPCTPIPFISNHDRIDDRIRSSQGSIELIKLHGCISRINDPEVPLVLTTDQYISSERGRDHLFTRLENWGRERPILFIGHSLQDPDIRTVLERLNNKLGHNRPRFFAVLRTVDDIGGRFWESKKVACIQATFHDFFLQLAKKIPSPFRAIAGTGIDPTTIDDFPIQAELKNDAFLSDNTKVFLQKDIDYIRTLHSEFRIKPKDFYRGFDFGWSSIDQGLDARRNLTDSILIEYVIIDEHQHEDLELIVIQGSAGSGKSVLLKRLAWDAAKEHNSICLYLKQDGVLNPSALQNIVSACRNRVFLFIDNIPDHSRSLLLTLQAMKDIRGLSIIGTARPNEWNLTSQQLDEHVSAKYELEYLTHNEINDLLDILEKNDALFKLSDIPREERYEALSKKAGRQLLVALHEATYSGPFEDIIANEFQKVQPPAAQQIYLTISTLNRLNVPVRAGIVSRIHGIPFESFRKLFFEPLERIVYASFNENIRDYQYRARHAHIAQIVFEEILKNPEDRFDRYMKCLMELDISYSDDEKAFYKMFRAKTLMELFTNEEQISSVFQIAQERSPENPIIYHQMGIYEMARSEPNLPKAAEHFDRAATLEPYNKSIKHSIAELAFKRAESAESSLTLGKYAQDVRKALSGLIGPKAYESHGYHTLLKTLLLEIRNLAEDPEGDLLSLEKTISEFERRIAEAFQKFPNDSYLFSAESRFAEFIKDSQRARGALQKAFENNPRNTQAALNLVRIFMNEEKPRDSLKILEEALEHSPNNQKLHYRYATILQEEADANDDLVLYHLKRSCSPGDNNFDAQLLLGRQLYVLNKFSESKNAFEQLKKAKLLDHVKRKPSYPLATRFRGRVDKKTPFYCFIKRDVSYDSIYCHSSTIERAIWENLVHNSQVEFNVAFNFYGPTAINLSLD